MGGNNGDYYLNVLVLCNCLSVHKNENINYTKSTTSTRNMNASSLIPIQSAPFEIQSSSISNVFTQQESFEPHRRLKRKPTKAP